VSGRWEYLERFPSTDEQAERLLSGAPEAEPYLKVYREWRCGVGVSVEHALLRASELAREMGADQRLREGGGAADNGEARRPLGGTGAPAEG
jgi:hypothetical protein